MTNRAPIFISKELHRAIKIRAAEEDLSMRALAETLLRRGMVADELAQALYFVVAMGRAERNHCPGCGPRRKTDTGCADNCQIGTALDAYEAANEPPPPKEVGDV